MSLQLRPWLRRLVTRLVAILPPVIVIIFYGPAGVYDLLIFSQVVLSAQLPFAIVPLIKFTSNRGEMGEFASALWVRVLAWMAAAVVIVLNVWLVAAPVAALATAHQAHPRLATAAALSLALSLCAILAALLLYLLWRSDNETYPRSSMTEQWQQLSNGSGEDDRSIELSPT